MSYYGTVSTFLNFVICLQTPPPRTAASVTAHIRQGLDPPTADVNSACFLWKCQRVSQRNVKS